jgi:phenylpropionate dioxygenase-like ring-hydroxylating dioxygenase large terminal subunit
MNQQNQETPMLTTAEKDYIIGESGVVPLGRANDQERKSPPLSAYLPDRERYAQVSPQRHYDPAYVQLEWDRLWAKVWMCAGRVSDLSEKNSWFRFDFARESFIIIRGAKDEITAVYNVCQHRGNRLVDDDFGKSPAFVCPYHSWTYNTTGKNIHVTDREFFREGALCGRLDLRKVKCEIYGGFVFISMDDDAPPLAQYLGAIIDITAIYPLEKLEVRFDLRLELACNWKVLLDAFSENYHVHITHPAFVDCTADQFSQMDFYKGGHSRRIVPVGVPSSRLPKTSTLNQMLKGLLQSAGIDPTTYKGAPEDVRRSIQLAKRAMNDARAEIYDRLSDNQLSDNWATNIFPNMHWSIHAEGLFMLRYEPHPSDPDKCVLYAMVLAYPGMDFNLYAPVDANAKRENSGRPSRIRARHDDPDVEKVVGRLTYEDIRNTREAQQGMKSKGFNKIRLSEHEQPIMHQYAEIDRYLGVLGN